MRILSTYTYINAHIYGQAVDIMYEPFEGAKPNTGKGICVLLFNSTGDGLMRLMVPYEAHIILQLAKSMGQNLRLTVEGVQENGAVRWRLINIGGGDAGEMLDSQSDS